MTDPYAGIPHPADVRPPPQRRTSWVPIDLTNVLAAGYEPPRPTVGHRRDGRGIFYQARSHTVVGESEGGKSFFVQYTAVQEIDAGNTVLYLDFEDSADSVAGRLMTLGCLPDDIRTRFAYISPDEPLTAPGALNDLITAVRDLRPTLVVLDGVTEALSLHGLSTNDNDEIAAFGRRLTRPLTATGAAVVSLDHVTKDREGRGRYAIGGVHKLNGLSGASYILENVDRFGDGLAGRSRLIVAKDRPGQVRPYAIRGTADRWWYADFTLDTSQPDPADITAPVEHHEPFRPTALMQKVSAALENAAQPLTTNDITARVQGKTTAIRTAIATLVDEGFIELTSGARGSRQHTLIKPYPGAQA